MQGTKQLTILSALLSALALGATGSAGAQAVTQEATPDRLPPSDSQTLIVVPPSPAPVPDPAASEKCKMVLPADYWDCVNSHNGS